MRTVIDAWADRTAALSALPGVEQVFCFENRGVEIGVTLAHPHGQIYGYPFVTPKTSTAIKSVRAHRAATGGNLFGELLAGELADGSRIVSQNEHWVAFVPFAARWPVEVHLYPRRQVRDLVALQDVERAALAELYLDVIRRMEGVFDDTLPAISGVHQAPVHADADDFWLHLEVFSIRRAVGKLKFLAGSESAMGAFVNDITPEIAAAAAARGRHGAPGPGDPMKALVVGGAGYIGSVVTRLLVSEGHDVVVLDDCSTGHADSVPAGVELVEADITTAADVLRGNDFDAVLHFAAKSLVGESVVKPSLYWRTNVYGTRVLLDAITETGVPRLVFSSTAATYGEPEAIPITEDAPTRPTNTYGATKLAVDMMITGECAATDLAAVSLRYFNVAGAAYGAGERHGVETHLIPIALDAVAGRRDALTIYGDDWPTPDGTPIRDYVHVADLARAHVLALTAAEPGEHLICNLGNGSGFSVREVLATIEEVTGLPVPVQIGPRRAGDPTRLVASADRAAARLGWTPERTLAEMVADAWAFSGGACPVAHRSADRRRTGAHERRVTSSGRAMRGTRRASSPRPAGST